LRLSVTDPEQGIKVSEIPIRVCSLEFMRNAFPPGAYQLMWRGERDGKRDVLGWSRPVELVGDDELDELEADADDAGDDDAPAPVVAPPAPAPSPSAFGAVGGALGESLSLMTILQSLKREEVQSHLAMFGEMQRSAVAMVQAVTQREASSGGGAIPNLPSLLDTIGQVLQQQGKALAALAEKVDALSSRDDDEEGDEEPIMRPGDRFGDVAAAAAVNTVVPALRENGKDLVRGLGALVEGLGEKMKVDAEARRTAATARSNGDIHVAQVPPAPPPVSDAPSS